MLLTSMNILILSLWFHFMKGHFRLVIIPWKAIAWTFGHTSYTELYHFALRSIWRMTRPKSLTSSKGNKCYSMRNYKMTMKKGSGFHMMYFNSWKLINIKSRACIRNMWICTSLIESCHTGLFYCCITWTLQFEGGKGKKSCSDCTWTSCFQILSLFPSESLIYKLHVPLCKEVNLSHWQHAGPSISLLVTSRRQPND